MPEIKSKKVLAVEGNDEVQFFDALLNYMNIGDCEIQEVGGKRQFKTKLPALIRTPGFSDIKILAIIRDANDSANAAFQSITNTLKKEKIHGQYLLPPSKMNKYSSGKPKIGIYIMPGNSEKGMLEDLCLKTVENHRAMNCVEDFTKCVIKLKNTPKNLSKAKAQAFLAAMPEIVNSVGLGVQKRYWNFDSGELSELKSFLRNLKS